MPNVDMIEKSARFLMDKNGLEHWEFKWNKRKQAVGTCKYGPQIIEMSKPWCLLNSMEEVRDTILHEIAHALTPGDHHGPKWRHQCRLLGCRPSRFTSPDSVHVVDTVDTWTDGTTSLEEGQVITVRIRMREYPATFVGHKRSNRTYPLIFDVKVQGQVKRYKLTPNCIVTDADKVAPLKDAAQTKNVSKPKKQKKAMTATVSNKKLSQAKYMNNLLEQGDSDSTIVASLASYFEQDEKWAKHRLAFHINWCKKNKPEFHALILDRD